MASARDVAIIFLDRNRLTYYINGLPNVVVFDIPLTCINDLEVINKDELATQVKAFISANKLQQSKIALIMAANTYFEKDFTVTPPPQDQQAFLDSVPFERILSKVFHLTAYRLVAVNAELYEAVRNSFEEEGYFVDSLSPASVLPQLDFKAGFTLAAAQNAAKHFDLLKTNTVITPVGDRTYSLAEGGNGAVTVTTNEPVKKDNPILVIILIIFILIVVVLAVLYSLGMLPSFTAAAPPPTPAETIVPPPAVVPQATPEVVASASASIAPTSPGIIPISVAPSGVKVQIFAPAGSVDKANAIKNSLTSVGFVSVTIAGANNIVTTQTKIEFAANLPQDIRDKVISQIRLVTPDIAGVDNKELSAQVNITLGKAN